VGRAGFPECQKTRCAGYGLRPCVVDTTDPEETGRPTFLIGVDFAVICCCSTTLRIKEPRKTVWFHKQQNSHAIGRKKLDSIRKFASIRKFLIRKFRLNQKNWARSEKFNQSEKLGLIRKIRLNQKKWARSEKFASIGSIRKIHLNQKNWARSEKFALSDSWNKLKKENVSFVLFFDKIEAKFSKSSLGLFVVLIENCSKMQ
jgi:hypothetical protein